MTEHGAAQSPVEVPVPHDPQLRHLRALIRMQIDAAGRGAWTTFGVLASEVREELARQAGCLPERAARAEVAHLQVRLERVLERRAGESAATLEARAAATAYRRSQRLGGARPSGAGAVAARRQPQPR